MLPNYVFAAERAEPFRETPSIELVQYRTQYSKRFKTGSGTLTDQVHLGSIHYQDVLTGMWAEVDTTLVGGIDPDYPLQTRASGLKGYMARATGGTRLVKLVYRNAEVRLLPLGVGQAASRARSNEVSFDNPFPATELKYVFESDRVKEYLILRSRAGALGNWRFQLDAPGMTPRQEANGDIGLYDEFGERLLELKHPTVVDSAGRVGTGSLTFREVDGSVILSLSVDKAWLLASERAYPITIDPTIQVAQQPFAGEDTFVSQPHSSINFADRFTLFTGKDTVTTCSYYCPRGITRSLVRFNLPGLPSGAWVTDAKLTLVEGSGNSATTAIDLYRVTSNWTATAATWLNQPSYSASSATSTLVSGMGSYEWPITQLVRDWYFGGVANFGVMLRHRDETADSHKEFWSSRHSVQSQRPILTITYKVDPLGREKFWGFAGNMNIANGNLVLSATDTAVPSRGLTASVTRTYNSRSSYAGPFGYGWTSEHDMRLIIPQPLAPDGMPRGPIAYIDLDRTVHYFPQNTSGGYDSPPGLYLKLTPANDGAGSFDVTEKNGLVYRYRFDGIIKKIQDHNGNEINFDYNTGGPGCPMTNQVDTITDSTGRTIVLCIQNGKVQSVTNQAQMVTSYGFDVDGNLVSVTVAVGTQEAYTVQYEYDEYHNLVAVRPPSGGKILYQYSDAGLDTERVLSVSQINAVVNASFEVDGDADGLPDFWISGGQLNLTSGPPAPSEKVSGTKVLEIHPSALTAGGLAYGVYLSNPIRVDPSRA